MAAGDGRSRFRLGVGLAAGVAVRSDEDGVVQVLGAGGQGAGHRQVSEDIGAPQQVEGGPVGPARALGQVQRIGDGLVHLGSGAVIGQLGVRGALGLVEGREHGHGYFGLGEVVGEGGGDGVVGLLRGVRIAAEAQGPVVVGQGDAQGARGVQVTDLIGAGQQVKGHIPDPSGGVDQVAISAKMSSMADCRVTCRLSLVKEGDASHLRLT